MIKEGFSGRLRRLRLQRKMTQARLAAQSGVTLRTYAYWEAGEHAPGIQELDSLVRALGLTPQERQAFIALLPPAKIGRIVRTVPDRGDILAPPGTGDLIRALRWRKRMSRDALALALGVHRYTVARWEDAHTVPGEETRLRLCDVLDALPPERAMLLTSHVAASVWSGGRPGLEVCREQTARLECESMGPADALFDLRAHLLAGTLYNFAARDPLARPVLAQTYAAHAAYTCLRGDDRAAIDYAGRSLALIEQGPAPPETVWYRALWAFNHALAHRASQAGPKQCLARVKQWLPRVRTPDVRAFLFLSAASWAAEIDYLREARSYWQQTRALTDSLPNLNIHFADAVQATYADLLVKEERYDEGLKANMQIDSALYPRQIVSLLFQTDVFLKAGDKNEADVSLRRAYGLITTHQVDMYRKQADGFAAQMERMA